MGILCALIQIYMILIIVRIVLTWFPLDPDGGVATIAGFLFVLTDPLLRPLRRALPGVRIGNVMLDLSPIIVIIGLQILSAAIC